MYYILIRSFTLYIYDDEIMADETNRARYMWERGKILFSTELATLL